MLKSLHIGRYVGDPEDLRTLAEFLQAIGFESVAGEDGRSAILSAPLGLLSLNSLAKEYPAEARERLKDVNRLLVIEVTNPDAVFEIARKRKFKLLADVTHPKTGERSFSLLLPGEIVTTIHGKPEGSAAALEGDLNASGRNSRSWFRVSTASLRNACYAFYSMAGNLVPGAVNSGDIYVRDVIGGTTTWASSGAYPAVRSVTPSTSRVVAYSHVLSTNGQFVTYQASAFPLTGPVSPGVVLRYDLTGALTSVISTNATVGSVFGATRGTLDMTPDGRVVAFVANTNGSPGKTSCVCVWDSDSQETTLASGGLSGSVQTNSICDGPRLDPNGQFVLFLSSATNLVTNSLGVRFPHLPEGHAGGGNDAG